MRLGFAALLAAVLVTGAAQAAGPGPSLSVSAPKAVVPSGRAAQVWLAGTNPGAERRLWVSAGRRCESPFLAALEVGEQFSFPVEVLRRKIGVYRVCASLALAEDDPTAVTAEASFQVGPRELRKLSLQVTPHRGRTARRPGATVFRMHASPYAHGALRTGRTRRFALGSEGRAAIRVRWSCARAGAHRYRLAVRDRYGHRRARTGSFRSRSCVGLRGFLVWPLHGRITSPFGYAERGRLHAGIDIDDNRSTKIRAAAWGKVVSAGWSDGYGLATVIDHGQGLRTLYGHQSSIRVHRGQRVRRGQLIGRVGCTGYCTGTHLHFGVLLHGRAVNPRRYLPPTCSPGRKRCAGRSGKSGCGGRSGNRCSPRSS